MTDPTDSHPGPALKAAREKLGVSANDVAESLNLGIKIVKDIESCNYDNLPVAAFTRGYIRAYAKLLELDADVFVSQYDSVAGGVEVPKLVVADPGMHLAELTQQHPGWVLGGSVGAVLVAVLLALWFVWPDESDVAGDMDIQALDDQMDARMDETSVPARVPASVLAIAETDPPTQGAPEAADPVSPAPELREPELREPEAREPETREPETREQGYVSQDASAEATPISANSGGAGIRLGDEAVTRRATRPDHVLLFSFSDDCWVEVKDSSGRSIYSDLNRSGQVLELAGEAPFRILLGYAPGVRLEYDGEPIALTPHTRNNVAQLVLGQ